MTASPSCCSKSGSSKDDPLEWFDGMIGHCLDYAREAHAQGVPIVGIMCEYTPRELILAAGGLPVCLCGGSAKTIPVAEQDLPANLCPLIKSTYGYHVMDSNPFLEMASLIVAETTCDGKKKMFELMGERRPMHILELPQKPDRAEGLAFWEQNLHELVTRLEDLFSVTVTDGALRDAIARMNHERWTRRALAALMSSDHPPLTGRQLINLKTIISGFPEAQAQLDAALAALTHRDGIQDSGSRVRVLMTGVPMVHGAEWVLDLVEERGGLVVATENCTGVKPLLEDVDDGAADPMRALAEKYYHVPCSVMMANEARLDMLRELVRTYRPQCVIELAWQACLTYSIEANRVKRLVEEEFGLPYLYIETDYSTSDAARVGVRVEALYESVMQQTRG